MRTRTGLGTRLLVAFLVVAGSVLAGAAILTYFLVRATAEDAAVEDLERRADEVGDRLRALRADFEPATSDSASIREALQTVVLVSRLADARIVFVAPDGDILEGRETSRSQTLTQEGDVIFAMPPDLSEAQLDGERLLAEESVRGVSDGTAFVARPLGRVPRDAPEPSVLVLTRDVDTGAVGRVGPLFLAAGAAAFVLAAGISLWLSRRLTRPLRDVEATARRLAAGDLAARVPVPDAAAREPAHVGDALNAMAAELERARGAERAFLLSVSHDLRTPLTSIRGWAEAIGDGTVGDDPRAVARAASVIGAEARRLERLVRDLLDLARLDSRQFSLRARPCDAAVVVSDAAEGLRPAAEDLDLALRIVGADRTIPAHLDPERVGQVVANLVENALTFATEGVEVAVHAHGGYVEVEVNDDGPGIPSADHGRVFERLYSTRGVPGRAVGTGLGLAIVRELVHAMGGAVGVEPTAAGGARFTARIPLKDPDGHPPAQAPDAASSRTSTVHATGEAEPGSATDTTAPGGTSRRT